VAVVIATLILGLLALVRWFEPRTRRRRLFERHLLDELAATLRPHARYSAHRLEVTTLARNDLLNAFQYENRRAKQEAREQVVLNTVLVVVSLVAGWVLAAFVHLPR
jgi:hypothetical protein